MGMPGENVFDTDPGRLPGISPFGDVDDAWIADRAADEIGILPFADIEPGADRDIADWMMLSDADGVVTEVPRFEPRLNQLLVGADPFI